MTVNSRDLADARYGSDDESTAGLGNAAHATTSELSPSAASSSAVEAHPTTARQRRTPSRLSSASAADYGEDDSNFEEDNDDDEDDKDPTSSVAQKHPAAYPAFSSSSLTDFDEESEEEDAGAYLDSEDEDYEERTGSSMSAVAQKSGTARIKLKMSAKGGTNATHATPTSDAKPSSATAKTPKSTADRKGAKRGRKPKSMSEPDTPREANSSITTKTAQVPPPTAVVELEKIIYRRVTSGEEATGGSSGTTSPVSMHAATAGSDTKEEFLIKFKNRSFMHCEWVDREWIETNDKRGKQRLKHFLEKTVYDISYSLISEDRPFNESYLKIDRVLEEMDYKDPFTGEVLHWFLVKWNALPYESASWESKPFLDSAYEDEEELQIKIQEFRRRSMLPHVRDPKHYEKCIPPGVRTPVGAWEKLQESDLTFKYGNQLRPYQLEGLNWLLYCWYHRQSCIIADEMGLGKTVQSVTFLNRLYMNEGVKGPFLIVAPLSTVPHWERTVNTWTDLNCVVFHGSAMSRNILQQYEFFYRDQNGRKLQLVSPPNPSTKSSAVIKQAYNQYKFDVLITTYEMAMSAAAILRNVPSWRCVIIDEAHRLKNKGSKVGEIMKSFSLEHRVLLTGTPIQNSLEELWSILNFLDPHRFGDSGEKEFLAEFNLKSASDVERLQALLKPLMLRRLKEDVEKSIPVKEETIIEVEMTKIQRAYYRAILERNFFFLKQGTKKSNVPNLINTMLELRKCCIHPYLIKGAEEKVLAEANAATHEDHLNCLIQSSGKLVLLDKLLPKLQAGGHRVLIFSQMTRCLDILSDYLRSRKYHFERIDGGIRGDARQAAIDRFSAPDSSSFVFLLCTRAGGVGINLTAADTCIIFDSDWNPQNDLQAQARCHRIGQKKNVKIYRLITRNTYEKTMFDRAGMKLGLDKAVLSRMDDGAGDDMGQGGPSALSKQEIDALLKRGAYAAILENEEDSLEDESKQFCEEDIDSILARRTQVIRRGGPKEGQMATEERQDGVVAAEGSLFSKASFSLGETTTAEDDLEDPLFWDKWAQKANLDPNAMMEEHVGKNKPLIVDEPRRRKRVQQHNVGEGSDLDDDEPSDRRKSKKPAVALWTLAERGRLERGLMLYGFGAWEKKIQNFTRRSINDIKSAEIRLLQWCSDSMKVSIVERKDARATGKAITTSTISASTSTDASNKRKSGVGREDTRVLREDERLAEDIDIMLRSMRWEVPSVEDVQTMAEKGCSGSFVAQEYKLEVDPELGPYPYPGASRDKLLAHRSLLDECPPEYLEALAKKKRNLLLRVQMLHYIRQGMIVVDPHAVSDVWTQKSVAAAADTEEEQKVVVDKYESLFESLREKHVFPGTYHMPSSYYSVHPGAAPTGAAIPNASVGSFNFDWWKEEEDRDLVVGTVKWGYQNYDQIRLDPELVFSKWKWTLPTGDSKAASAEGAAVDSDATPVPVSATEEPQDPDVKPWPSGSELGCRLRRLIHLYQRQTREDEGTKPGAALIADGEGGYMMEQDHRWSKRDRAEFIKTANFWGIPEEEVAEMTALEAKRKHYQVLATLPGSDRVLAARRDWTMFKQIGGFGHKPDIAMEVFLQAFIKRLEEIVKPEFPAAVELPRSGGILLWGEKPSTGDEDGDAMEEDGTPSDGESQNEEAIRQKVKIGSNFSTVLGAEPKDWSNNALDTCEGVTPTSGKHMLRRIALLHTLRKHVLKNERVRQYMEYARHGVGLPDWWSTAEMDYYFLVGISRYGMSPSLQYRIMLDPKYPFRNEVGRILADTNMDVDLDAYAEKRGTMTKKDLKKPESAGQEEDMVDVVDVKDVVAGSVNIEDIVGWPGDILRTRRIEYLVKLVLRGGENGLPTIRKRRAEENDDDTMLGEGKKRKVNLHSGLSSLHSLEQELTSTAAPVGETDAMHGSDLARKALDAVRMTQQLLQQLERIGHDDASEEETV